MYEWENNFDYKIKEIETQFSEFHDKILMKELVEFCGIHDVFDYEISIDMLKEALDLYIQKKEKEKFGKDNNVPTKKTNFEKIKEELTIEAMAELLYNFNYWAGNYCFMDFFSKHFSNNCDRCPFAKKKNKYRCSKEVDIRKWLESEVEE